MSNAEDLTNIGKGGEMEKVYQDEHYTLTKKTPEDYFNDALECFFNAGITIKGIVVDMKTKRKISLMASSLYDVETKKLTNDTDFGTIEIIGYARKNSGRNPKRR